tara:strand:+ start:16068 stop:17039 length:972 start_codon:yes stop_codon:yes gene_type:complete
MNSKTGFGHYNRVKILLDILKIKKAEIYTENRKLAHQFFEKHKIIKGKNILNYLINNHYKYKLLIIDPPYYPNQLKQQEFFSKKFKKIFNIKNKKFKIIWLSDEEKPSPKYCDLLLNDYPLAKKFKYFYKKFNKKIQLILGIYAFLFSKEVFTNKQKTKKKHVLIAFGGDDPKNLILRFFDFFKTLDFKKIFIVNIRTYKILKKYDKNKNLFIIKKKPMNKFLNYLRDSIFYISTPSNIMFESWAFGIKGNVIPIQKRQLKMGQAFKKLNLVNLLPYYKFLSKKILSKKIKTNSFLKPKIIFKKKYALKNQIKLIKFYKKIHD